jgi:hypothetical protein
MTRWRTRRRSEEQDAVVNVASPSGSGCRYNQLFALLNNDVTYENCVLLSPLGSECDCIFNTIRARRFSSCVALIIMDDHIIIIIISTTTTTTLSFVAMEYSNCTVWHNKRGYFR